MNFTSFKIGSLLTRPTEVTIRDEGILRDILARYGDLVDYSRYKITAVQKPFENEYDEEGWKKEKEISKDDDIKIVWQTHNDKYHVQWYSEEEVQKALFEAIEEFNRLYLQRPHARSAEKEVV
jgi:hypothetical protein